MSRSLKAHILLVFITFAWGSTFVLVKNALAEVSPLVFNTLRMVIAAVALVVIFHRALGKITRKSAQAGAIVGIFLFLGYAFQTTGLRLTTPSKSAFITGLAVVLVPIIVAVSGRRLPNRWTLVGVLFALIGLYLMTIPSGEGFSLASINRGDLLTLGCAASFAMHIFAIGRATERHPFEHISIMQVATAAVLMALIIPVETPKFSWSTPAMSAILFTALICTAAAFSIQSWAQQFTPPTHTALIFALEPVFAAMTSYVLLGERLGVRGTIGAILILSGILVSELRGSALEADRIPQVGTPSN
ncbi:MAG TPA: DMT family transporter [Terriglobales bacterium]|nr:DMT family transporter [Terriglobales bacterium]